MAKRTKRRGRGEGSIYQQTDGRWSGAVEFSTNGKRKRKVVYGKTKREVQDKLAVLQNQKATGTVVDASRMTVGQWLRHWVETIAKPRIRVSTYIDYRQTIDLHVNPRIGSVQLSKLAAVNVQAMYAAMEGDGHSSRKQLKAHAVLRASLNTAVKQGLVVFNVCHRVDPPRYTKPEMQTLDAEQVSALLAASEGGRLHALIVLAVTTGMRQGELLGLSWDDIDLSTGMLSVRRTLININGKLSFGPPKTQSGVRAIRLPAVAVGALHAHRAEMLREGHVAAATVFCDRQGGPVRVANFYRRYYKPLLKRAGVPDVRFHDLRHTSATLMLADNVPPKIVQQRLGHSKVSITLDTYSHVLPSMDAAAAGTFDRQLRKDA